MLSKLFAVTPSAPPPSKMWSALKRKNLLHYREVPFAEGTRCARKETRSREHCLPCIKWWKIYSGATIIRTSLGLCKFVLDMGSSSH